MLCPILFYLGLQVSLFVQLCGLVRILDPAEALVDGTRLPRVDGPAALKLEKIKQQLQILCVL